MKRFYLVISLGLSFSLTGCSLLSTMINKFNEPKFKEKGSLVDRNTFMEEYDKAFNNVVYYDNEHINSFTAKSTYIESYKSFRKNKNNKTVKNYNYKEKRSINTKYSKENVLWQSYEYNDSSDYKTQTEKSNDSYISKEDVQLQIEDNDIYRFDNIEKKYASIIQNNATQTLDDNAKTFFWRHLVWITDFFNSYTDTDYYINNRIFTIVQNESVERDIIDKIYDPGTGTTTEIIVGTRSFVFKRTIQFNFTPGKFSYQFSYKNKRIEKFTKNTTQEREGDISTSTEEEKHVSTFDFNEPKGLKKKSISNYEKIDSINYYGY